MSIASEITRLQGVKSDILQAISDKGVVVPAGSALDDCPDLIASISSGGGEEEIVIPTGYKRLQWIEINGTTPYCDIYLPSFGIQWVNYSDEIEISFLLNADQATGKALNLFERITSGPHSNNSWCLKQYLNYNGNGYAIEFLLNGLYNYGAYQKTVVNYGSQYATGLYNVKSYYDDDLKGEVNSSIVQLGTAPADFPAQLTLFRGGDEYAPAAYKGTKFFSVKVGKNGEKLNFIPCQNIGNSTVGLWENNNEVFVYPKDFSAGCFDPGPDY